jgi:TonB family protein
MLKRIALALLCATAATSAAAADTDTKPVLAGIKECSTPPRVPDSGAVKLSFRVTETGAVEDVRVETSSGNADSDARAAKCVAGNTYHPATHNGVPVAAPMVFNYHWGRVEEMTGDKRAFAALERDADRRCHKLFPIDRRFDLPGQPITLVGIARLPSGEIQTKIIQSAGPKPDANAVKCMLEIVHDHDDLPATFVRTISIDWSHR